jgi:hypothetical protein
MKTLGFMTALLLLAVPSRSIRTMSIHQASALRRLLTLIVNWSRSATSASSSILLTELA